MIRECEPEAVESALDEQALAQLGRLAVRAVAENIRAARAFKETVEATSARPRTRVRRALPPASLLPH